jgi:uncharacterized protein YbcI
MLGLARVRDLREGRTRRASHNRLARKEAPSDTTPAQTAPESDKDGSSKHGCQHLSPTRINREQVHDRSPMEPADPTSRAETGAIASQISREIVRLHANLYGRGPTKAKTHLSDEFAMCILEEVFTQAEKTLIRAGNTEQVKATRDAFQDAVETQFREVVETATGRQVRAFVSVVNTDIDAAFEIFLFENNDRGENHDGNLASVDGSGS